MQVVQETLNSVMDRNSQYIVLFSNSKTAWQLITQKLTLIVRIRFVKSIMSNYSIDYTSYYIGI